MSSNEETLNQEPLDEAALNEEASRELAAMVAEAEQTSGATEEDTGDDAPLSAPQSVAERAGVIEALIFVSDEPDLQGHWIGNDQVTALRVSDLILCVPNLEAHPLPCDY